MSPFVSSLCRLLAVSWCYNGPCQPAQQGAPAVSAPHRSPRFPMSRLASVLCVAVLFSSAATIARAQETASGDPPAHISLVDGTAVLERDGKTETAPTSMPLLAGDRLRTENGRVEVLFSDNSTLHLDTSSTV